MGVTTITNTFPLSNRISRASKYQDFARSAASYLQRRGNTIIFSPAIYGGGNGFTIRLVFRSGGETVKAENLRHRDAFAGRLFRKEIDRIILNSGTREEDIMALFEHLIDRSIDPKLSLPNIDIQLKDPTAEKKVLSLLLAAAPKRSNAIIPPVAPPPTTQIEDVKPAAQAQPVIKTPQDFLTHGKELRRQQLQTSLSSGLRTEIEDWMEQAKALIQEYVAQVSRRWTAELLEDRHIFLKILEHRQKLQRLLNISVENIKIPHYRNDYRLPPRATEMRGRAHHPRPITRPLNNSFDGTSLYSLGQACKTLGYGLDNGIWSLSSESRRELKQLRKWLRYLLHENNLQQEYGEEATRYGYKRLFSRFYSRIKEISLK